MRACGREQVEIDLDDLFVGDPGAPRAAPVGGASATDVASPRRAHRLSRGENQPHRARAHRPDLVDEVAEAPIGRAREGCDDDGAGGDGLAAQRRRRARTARRSSRLSMRPKSSTAPASAAGGHPLVGTASSSPISTAGPPALGVPLAPGASALAGDPAPRDAPARGGSSRHDSDVDDAEEGATRRPRRREPRGGRREQRSVGSRRNAARARRRSPRHRPSSSSRGDRP
ncbi:MAG: hypothetical protein U0575_03415 [Phycisphaerales bacterium]